MSETTTLPAESILEDGFYSDIPNETYHADKSAISSTTLKNARRSAAHLKAALDGDRTMSGRHLVLGNAIHCAVLEPEKFDDEYAVAPTSEELEHHFPSSSADLLVIARQIRDSLVSEITKNNPDAIQDCSTAALTQYCRDHKIRGFSAWNTAAKLKEGIANAMSENDVTVKFLDDILAASPAAAFSTVNKATKDELKAMILSVHSDAVFQDEAAEAHLEGKIELSRAEYDTCMGIRAAVAAHPKANKLLTGGEAETSVFYTHTATGCRAKARADYYRRDLGVIADLKSCEDARPEAVARAIFNYGYHISGAMYLDAYRSAGLEANTFVWVFVEKQPPYGVRVYVASPELLSRGDEDYNAFMDIYAHGVETGNWPGYVVELESIDLPAWANK